MVMKTAADSNGHLARFFLNLKGAKEPFLSAAGCHTRPSMQILTINIPVVCMGRDVWIWMGGNPQRGPFEGVGPEIETFLGPEMATSEASAIWA